MGNGLETREALRCLAGGGPEELADLSAALVGEMLYLGGLEESPEAGTLRAREALAQGRALGRMARLIEFQGGDPKVVDDPHRIPQAPEVKVLNARSSGFVGGISPVSLGYGVVELGGGRRRLGDSADLRVGFVMEVRLGDWVEAGDPLGEVHAADTDGMEKGLGILENAVTTPIGSPPTPLFPHPREGSGVRIAAGRSRRPKGSLTLDWVFSGSGTHSGRRIRLVRSQGGSIPCRPNPPGTSGTQGAPTGCPPAWKRGPGGWATLPEWGGGSHGARWLAAPYPRDRKTESA